MQKQGPEDRPPAEIFPLELAISGSLRPRLGLFFVDLFNPVGNSGVGDAIIARSVGFDIDYRRSIKGVYVIHKDVAAVYGFDLAN